MPDPTTSADPAGQPNPPKPAPPADKPPVVSPDPPKEKDEPLGEGGLKALKAEREAREALEKQLKRLAPLQQLAEALGASGTQEDGKSEIEKITERLAKHETELAAERSARWRAEIANEKGLTIEQAARLVGDSKDALAADADALRALFPTAPAAPGTPKPDPSQGARGPVGLDARIAEAEKNGDFKTAIALKSQQLLKKP